MFTFHQTVRGYNHLQSDTVCQDYSASFSDNEKNYHIIVVADGHGDTPYFRSDIGAELATKISVKCLKELVEESKIDEERLAVDSSYRKEIIKHLTDRIVSAWHNAVIDHYKQNGITHEEIARLKKDNIKIPSEEDIPHIYGTTLLAGLMIRRTLILIQQGDGTCEVFYNKKEKDGSYGPTKVREPIPIDPECQGRYTTSLCDSDVARRIRTSYVDLNKIKIIACYVSSDGVEKSYRDSEEALDDTHPKMGGVHAFYKNLSCEIVERREENFTDNLSDMLSEFSKKGLFCKTSSGDDISVAGIVDIEALKTNVDNFKKDIEIYKLEEEIFWKKDKLRGKTRKHEILKRRLDEAIKKYEEAKKPNKDIFSTIRSIFLRNDKKHKEELSQIIELYTEALNKFKEYDLDYKKIENEIKSLEDNKIQLLSRKPSYTPRTFDYYSEDYKQKIEDLTEENLLLKEEISSLKDQIKEAEEAEEEARKQAEEEARKQAEEEPDEVVREEIQLGIKSLDKVEIEKSEETTETEKPEEVAKETEKSDEIKETDNSEETTEAENAEEVAKKTEKSDEIKETDNSEETTETEKPEEVAKTEKSDEIKETDNLEETIDSEKPEEVAKADNSEKTTDSEKPEEEAIRKAEEEKTEQEELGNSNPNNEDDKKKTRGLNSYNKTRNQSDEMFYYSYTSISISYSPNVL